MPKREHICMVYNGTSSGLKYAQQAPKFSLRTVRSTLRETQEGTYMADWEIGEMLLNFMVSKDIKPYCGVDISKV